MLSDEIKGVNSYTAWSSDSKTFFYTGKDEETLRSDRIFRHNIGDDQRDDEIVYEKRMKHFQPMFIHQNQGNIFLLDLRALYLVNIDTYQVILQIKNLKSYGT